MSFSSMWKNLKRIHQQLNGCTVEYDLNNYRESLEKINKQAHYLKNRTDRELKSISMSLIESAHKGITEEDLLIDSFSLVKETISRILNQTPFDEQIIGGLVLNEGKIAEMQTGEGKTLTAVFVAYLQALSGKGVHVLTFNDYLASRDSMWMEPVYKYLGLTVGLIQEGMSIRDRQKAYQADITFLTAKESGFDFLRDHLCYKIPDVVQRRLNFAIIDEADSILIDEARVPLVIAGSVNHSTSDTTQISQIVEGLCLNVDYEFDEYQENVLLTENGIRRIENELQCDNLYDVQNISLLESVNHSLQAHFLLHKDKDYLVRDDKIEIIDEFSGRIADKRRWPDGLHEAIEIKENCTTNPRGKILNTITLQHYLKKYPKISGMTATAQASEEEFRETYRLHIVVINPHRRCIRIDHDDLLFKTKNDKLNAVVEEIIAVHKTGRPILVGTQSVRDSAILADMLQMRGIRCEVLNAGNDAYEAVVISKAGKSGAITISTNMAGRGTDIRLGGHDEEDLEKIKQLGGLYVIGTNRYESQRIDFQLRGRSARQGDPGSSRFFISLEDDLFKKYDLRGLVNGNPEEMINSKELKIEIDRIQKIIDGRNLDIKMNLYNFSELIDHQREIINGLRDDVLFADSIPDFFYNHCQNVLFNLQKLIGETKLIEICKYVYLSCIDQVWSDYLSEIYDIMDSIHLRKIGGQDPLFEFRKICITQFELMMKNIEDAVIELFNKILLSDGTTDLNVAESIIPSSTWTYILNNQQDHSNGLNYLRDAGVNAWTGLLWPLTVLVLLVRKILEKKKR